jgi:hypothetical protein
MAEETFRIIKGIENYSVSNLGRVKNNSTDRILKPNIDTRGYYNVKLYQDGIKLTKNIHKLVGDAFIQNPFNKSCIDHINNNKLDNNVNNLRWVSSQENSMNRKISSKNTSNYKGVTFHKQTNKWQARIMINGKSKHLGLFEKIEDAVNARVKKAEEVFGEYINKCEKEVTININIPVNTKVKLNINIKSKEDQELEELEKEFNDILNKK